uniref:Uncharacterized protein n=1 Tax=Arundo donax TaxID=35708 RepID=A0A0A9AS02_ARUDO
MVLRMVKYSSESSKKSQRYQKQFMYYPSEMVQTYLVY